MQQRYASLDGLRGLAALSVVAYHFLCAYLPSAVAMGPAPPVWFIDNPAAIFYNGRFAVTVFFVLSGFVVAGAAARGGQPLIAALGFRYLRLAGPVLASTLFAWALLNLWPGGVAHLKAAMVNDWLDYSYDGATPGLLWAAYDGALGAFLRGSSLFNNVLWTMQIELVASFVIYGVYGLTAGLWKWLAIAAAFAVALMVKAPYEPFVLGVLLWEARARLPGALAWPALVLGLFCGVQLPGMGDRLGLEALPRALELGRVFGFLYVAGATALVFAALVHPAAKALFEGAVAQFLGRISFGLYLAHAPLLYTAFALLYGRMPLTALLCLFLAASIALGWAMTVLADEPTLRAIRWARARLAASSRRGRPGEAISNTDGSN